MNNEQKEQMIKTNAFDGVSFDPAGERVWKSILHQKSAMCGFIIWFAMIYEYSGIQVFWEKLDMFCKDCKYLGKSKANIDDLFKTDEKEYEKWVY